MIARWTDPPEDEAQPKGFDDYDLRLGDIMRGERATLGKSLLDVQRELKIRATYVAAIENCDPSAFETQGFIAGYVRSYARYLNLDPEWAYQTFCAESGFATSHGMSPAASDAKTSGRSTKAARKAAKPDPFADPNALFVPRSGPRYSGIPAGAIGSIAVLAMLIGGIGYGGWSVLKEIQKVQFAPVDQTPGVTASLDPLAPAEEIISADAEAEIATPSVEAFDRLYRPEALDVPVLVARDGPIATLDPARNGALIPPAPPEAPAERLAAVPAGPIFPEPDGATLLPVGPQLADLGDVPEIQVVEAPPREVVMFAVRPAWVRVRGADGTVLFEKILDAGETYVLPATEEAPVLRAGNAGSVYFRVNGETYGPAGQGPSVVKDVALSAEALTGSYQVADLDADAELARIVAVAEAEISADAPTPETPETE